MPPADPRQRPDLQVAVPDDFEGAVSDPVPFPEPWSIQFGGTTRERHDASVTGRWRTPDNREIIDVTWSAGGLLWTETYFADPARMRRRW